MTRKHFVVLLLAFVAGCVLASIANGQITGPSRTQAGTLAVFESEAPADWSVSPTQATTGMFFPDSTGTKLFFASPLAGEYEVNAAVVIDGKAKLFTFTFVNGTGGPVPTPEPVPVPEPLTLADWVKANIPVDATPAEINMVRTAFARTASGIDRNTIKTPDQAFAAIRTTAGQEATWKTFLEKLSERDELKTSDVKAIGKAFEAVSEGMSTPEPAAAPSLVPTGIGPDCPDGNCPTQQKPITTRRWR